MRKSRSGAREQMEHDSRGTEESTLTNTHRGLFSPSWSEENRNGNILVSTHEIHRYQQQSPEIKTNLCENFTYNNGGIISQWRKDGFLLVKKYS